MESEGMGREEVCSTISSLPGHLSHEDVEDFFSLAHYYATRTPQSFRKVTSRNRKDCVRKAVLPCPVCS